MDHIYLTRDTDLIIVAPATANIMAKMVQGIADDLASATLLAKNKPVLIAPAMNVEMWDNEATQANYKMLSQREDISLLGPAVGSMACGETGAGRMVEPEEILKAAQNHFRPKSLAGLKAIVTAGPTHEPIDPVRYIGNRSSGKQGYAVARALAALGADVTLVSGPTSLPGPKGVKTILIETAREMLDACEKSLPADIFVAAAAVSDWVPETVSAFKIKKVAGEDKMNLALKQNPDILKTIGTSIARPRYVVGFAAETDDVLTNAAAKLETKGTDMIVANLISPENPAFGVDDNQVHLVTRAGTEELPKMGKDEVANAIGKKIAAHFQKSTPQRININSIVGSVRA
jgi:phosphopantothenoylcysteine decarboxylase/phosphopantothenate--cysteine ligase